MGLFQHEGQLYGHSLPGVCRHLVYVIDCLLLFGSPLREPISHRGLYYMFGVDGGPASFGFIFTLGVAYGIMLIDFLTSASLFSRISKIAKDSGLAERYEEMRVSLRLKKEEAGERFFDAIPEKVKEGLEKAKESLKPKAEAKSKLAKIFLIDPSKADSASENYDESGRPKKEE